MEAGRPDYDVGMFSFSGGKTDQRPYTLRSSVCQGDNKFHPTQVGAAARLESEVVEKITQLAGARHFALKPLGIDEQVPVAGPDGQKEKGEGGQLR